MSCKSSYYNDFWRSCDTEDWSNDAENTDLINKLRFNIYLHKVAILNSLLNMFLQMFFIKLMQACWVYSTFFINIKKSYQPQTFERNVHY